MYEVCRIACHAESGLSRKVHMHPGGVCATNMLDLYMGREPTPMSIPQKLRYA